MGSYRAHGDAQCESFRLVEESKDFVRAVKADDVEIPIHLWNDRLKAPGVSKERRDKALVGLHKLGMLVQESPAERLFGLPHKHLWGRLGEKATSKKGRREDRAGSQPRSNHQPAVTFYPHQLV